MKKNKTFRIRSHLREAKTEAGSNGSKFQVVLIQEGMGNLKDCFYYTKQALQSSYGIFEGKKAYADHPSSLEENIRPERSVRDVIGYYAQCGYAEGSDGRGQIVASLVTVADPNVSWAQALLSNSIDYAQQFPDADFVGLSINASGEANEVALQDFMAQGQIPSSCLPKLQEAQAQGIDSIKVVSALKDAISCDLVTDAGAGGRILKMIESSKERKPMAKTREGGLPFTQSKKKKEAGIDPKDNLSEAGIDPKDNMSEAEAGEDGSGAIAPGAPGSGDSGMGMPDHADADQDKALFAQLIQQYLGDGAEGVNPDEAHEMAKHAYQAATESGMGHDEAMEAAGKHIKMAHEVGKRMQACKQSESEHESESESESKEAHEGFPPAAGKKPMPPGAPKPAAPAAAAAPAAPAGEPTPKKQVEKYYEARAQILRLQGENAKLRESLKKFELKDYLDRKMSESKKPVKVTAKFREAVGSLQSREQIDQSWKIFSKALEGFSEEAEDDFSGFIFTEKNSFQESISDGTVGSLSDCFGSED